MKGQMGRIIGPKGSNIKKLRAESGACMSSEDASGVLVITGPDMSVVTKGARWGCTCSRMQLTHSLKTPGFND
jgi:hypothetical protein